MDTIEELNAKILKITMTIKNQHSELSKYLEEMPITVPDEKNPKIAILNLKHYFESLNLLLNKYIIEQNSKRK